jgi:AcrR family transcriptional regulator
MSGKPLRDEHAEITRNAVISAARAEFAARGYDAVSLDEIATAARVTKGAIYHHFANKRDLFRTVYEQLAGEVEDRVRRRIARAGNPLERAELAIDAFLDFADDDAVRSVMFRDGLVALGGECRAIDGRYYLALIRQLLDDFAAAGLLADIDTAMVARLLLGVVIEGSSLLAEPERPRHARASLRIALRRMLGGFLR